ncbi:hypothetical protein C0Q70_00587 [Pomacea canaliculata]|uniref:Uncharacterized protein n=1 Tax=Pomacea canaliculata TaxID=400727 RepID=A0A2T7PX35_POMCA|nr:hypothetical protein C0Q70_00587 [Pomacea canaliculata]
MKESAGTQTSIQLNGRILTPDVENKENQNGEQTAPYALERHDALHYPRVFVLRGPRSHGDTVTARPAFPADPRVVLRAGCVVSNAKGDNKI